MKDCLFSLLCASGQTKFHHCTFCLSYLVRAPFDGREGRLIIPYIVCPSVRCAFFTNPTSDRYLNSCPRCESPRLLSYWEEET